MVKQNRIVFFDASGDAIIRDHDVKHKVHDILIHTSFYKQICVITISEFAIV